jgi:hypothetical protein
VAKNNTSLLLKAKGYKVTTAIAKSTGVFNAKKQTLKYFNRIITSTTTKCLIVMDIQNTSLKILKI